MYPVKCVSSELLRACFILPKIVILRIVKVCSAVSKSEFVDLLDDYCEDAKGGCFSWGRGGCSVIESFMMLQSLWKSMKIYDKDAANRVYAWLKARHTHLIFGGSIQQKPHDFIEAIHQRFIFRLIFYSSLSLCTGSKSTSDVYFGTILESNDVCLLAMITLSSWIESDDN